MMGRSLCVSNMPSINAATLSLEVVSVDEVTRVCIYERSV